MKLVKDAIPYINPRQTPIIGIDQLLYDLPKQNQWARADVYGESSYVEMMGGLHSEMASLEMDGWILTWSTLPEASKVCNEFIKCGCKGAYADSASAPRQTCPALHCAPGMAVAGNSDNARTQLPPKRHRTLTFISFFRMSSILKVQNVLLHRNVSSTMLYRCYLQNTIAHYHLNGFFD